MNPLFGLRAFWTTSKVWRVLVGWVSSSCLLPLHSLVELTLLPLLLPAASQPSDVIQLNHCILLSRWSRNERLILLSGPLTDLTSRGWLSDMGSWDRIQDSRSQILLFLSLLLERHGNKDFSANKSEAGSLNILCRKCWRWRNNILISHNLLHFVSSIGINCSF